LKHNKEELSATKQIMQLVEKSSLDKNVLVIRGINDSEIDYTIHDGWLAGWAEKEAKDANYHESLAEPGDEVCKGGGYSFARCVQENIDEGKCLKLYEVDGDYVAEEISCNDHTLDPNP